MLDIASVLGIVSIITTVILGGHYVFKSKCFGVDVQIETQSKDDLIDIHIGESELELKRTGEFEIK